MPPVTLATAEEWPALAQAAGADPGVKAVGDEVALVVGPVDVTVGAVDALDFAVVPACGGHNLQPGAARISGFVKGPAGATATVKFYNGGTDLLSAAVLTRPSSPDDVRATTDVDVSGASPIAEGTALKLECTALSSGATGVKGLAISMKGLIST